MPTDPRRALIVLAFAGILAGFVAGAQEAQGNSRVDGWVKDKNGQPIAEATVELSREKGGRSSVKTNKKGYWAVPGLAEGAWDIEVSAPGYETRKVSVRVSEATRIPPVEIQLDPAAAPVAAPVAGSSSEVAQEVRTAIEEGNRLLGEKKYRDARAQYEKALAVVPANPALLKGIAQTYIGEGNRGQAIEVLRKIRELEPNDADNKLLLALLLLEEGKLEEGQAILGQLPSGTLKDPLLSIKIGILLLNRNDFAQAQAAFSKAIELDPSRAEAYYYRGISYWKAKRSAEAKADLKKYLDLAPEGNEAKEAREILQTLK